MVFLIVDNLIRIAIILQLADRSFKNIKRKNSLLKRIYHHKISKNNTDTHILITENQIKFEYGLGGRNYKVMNDQLIEEREVQYSDSFVIIWENSNRYMTYYFKANINIIIGIFERKWYEQFMIEYFNKKESMHHLCQRYCLLMIM